MVEVGGGNGDAIAGLWDAAAPAQSDAATAASSIPTRMTSNPHTWRGRDTVEARGQDRGRSAGSAGEPMLAAPVQG